MYYIQHSTKDETGSCCFSHSRLHVFWFKFTQGHLGVCPTTGEASRLLTFSKFGVGKGMATSNIFKSVPVLLSWTPKLIYLQSYPWSFSMRPVPSISSFCLPGLVICDGILTLWNNLVQLFEHFWLIRYSHAQVWGSKKKPTCTIMSWLHSAWASSAPWTTT